MNVLPTLIMLFYLTGEVLLLPNLSFANDKLTTKTNCGVDQYNKEFLAENPHLKPTENEAYKILQKRQNINYKNNSATYTIPMVVHIVHNYGYENISNSAVTDGVNDLNDGMRANTQNNGFIHPDFDSLKTDTKIEFVLAKFDPDGNPTNGIVRHQSRFFTENGSKAGMRFEYHWPRDKYLNLYIVRQPFANSNSSGFATFPYLVNEPDKAYLDGIVLAYWAFGRHNFLYNEWYYMVAHEVGHWLNLYHIWGPDEQLCDEDDGLEDTPNTIGNTLPERSACINTSFQCNSLDNITNHMDYATPCQAMFTTGQTNRMYTTLNSSVSERSNLHSPENLELTLGITNEQVCEDDILDLSNTIITENIAANSTIITNGIVPNTYSITLNAQDSIKLKSGFKVETGAAFKAYNEPCTNP